MFSVTFFSFKTSDAGHSKGFEVWQKSLCLKVETTKQNEPKG
jgi:hypothetical protein